MPMESEGPRTLLRAKRRETAAEQMSRQQSEFEDRSGPVRDEAKQAATHNETHPKLKRQLDKRRSVTERRETVEVSRQQTELEDRSGPVRDEAKQAATHNETHPKLKRLDKRRSVTVAECEQPGEKNSSHKKRVQISENVCSAVQEEGGRWRELRRRLKRPLDGRREGSEFLDRPVKRMRLSHPDHERGSRHYRRRQSRRKPDRPRRPRTINRVAKRRERRPCTCSKCFKKPICRKNVANLCVYVVNKRIGTDTLPLEETVLPVLKPKKSIQGSKHSVGLHTPASRNQSVSSYNSFDSSDHPPVV